MSWTLFSLDCQSWWRKWPKPHLQQKKSKTDIQVIVLNPLNVHSLFLLAKIRNTLFVCFFKCCEDFMFTICCELSEERGTSVLTGTDNQGDLFPGPRGQERRMSTTIQVHSDPGGKQQTRYHWTAECHSCVTCLSSRCLILSRKKLGR